MMTKTDTVLLKLIGVLLFIVMLEVLIITFFVFIWGLAALQEIQMQRQLAVEVCVRTKECLV